MIDNDRMSEGQDGSSEDYNSGLLEVDPSPLDLEDSEDEDQLMIDCDEDTEDGYDPLSLVSVGLDEDEEDMDDEEEDDDDDLTIEEKNVEQCCTFCSDTFANRKLLNLHILSEHQKSCSVACQYCGRVLSDGDSYRRHLDLVHQVRTIITLCCKVFF